MILRWSHPAAWVALVGLVAPQGMAATLTVQELVMSTGQVATVVVEGSADNESTFGVTIVLEIIPRAGNSGTLTFTPAPPTDVGLAGHPWLGAGGFTAYDTDLTGAESRNGAVFDNGTFVPNPVTYNGLLAGFPVVASTNASGTWDVLLWTAKGESSWEGLPTTLTPSTVTVVNPAEIPAVSTWSLMILVLFIATAGTVMLARARRTN